MGYGTPGRVLLTDPIRCGLVATVWLFAPSAHATHVTVRVLNVSTASGVVRVALCRETEWQTHACSYGGQSAARVGVVEVGVDVPAGIYGILIHHDANGDRQVNKNFLGIPIEGVGFSRDAHIVFGFPRFSAVSVELTGVNKVVVASLIFEPSGVSVNAK